MELGGVCLAYYMKIWCESEVALAYTSNMSHFDTDIDVHVQCIYQYHSFVFLIGSES